MTVIRAAALIGFAFDMHTLQCRCHALSALAGIVQEAEKGLPGGGRVENYLLQSEPGGERIPLAACTDNEGIVPSLRAQSTT